MSSRPHPARAGRLTVFTAIAGLLVLGAVVRPSTAEATPAADTGAWDRTGDRPAADRPATVRPTRYAAYSLDRGDLVRDLRSGRVEVPDPTGRPVAFRVSPSTVMEPGLAAAHPELQSWAGTAVDGAATIRVDATPGGVHVSVRGDGPSWYVDPAYRDDDSLYLSYAGADLPEPQRGLVEPPLPESSRAELAARADAAAAQSTAPGAAAALHTYRLALVSDPSFASFTAPGADPATSNAKVLASKVVLVDRLDQIYGADLGIRLLLVDNTDTRLNLRTAADATGANGPCGLSACYPASMLAAGCTQSVLDRNRWVIGQLIGARNYDVGHLTLGVQGGGIAYVGAVGRENKAGGCTGLSSPSGDGYAVDYLAHELGHQFGADHTFDGTTGSCAASRSAGTAVEPGSGSTIMAYAGICGADDLQAHSDPVFSAVSRDEIDGYIDLPAFPVSEYQSVALTGFDGTDSFKLTVGGATTTAITRGSTYTVAGIKAALLAVLPGGTTVQVKSFFSENAFDDRGFGLYFTTYAGTFAGDVPEAKVVPVGGQFTSAVNDIDAGNPAATAAGTVTTPGNHNPTVTAPADRTIPVGTPFSLTGTGTDPDGNALGYVWEQTDPGTGSALATQLRTAGPLFRVFGTASNTFQNVPDVSGATRSFPDLAQVVAGNTNAATGSCPAGPGQVDCLSELLPTAAYTGSALHFRLTARDSVASAAGVASDDVVLTLDKTSGPFRVTSQATTPQTAYAGGSTRTVTWTTGTSALAANVRITLSSDGGVTFPYVLAASTPNDGTNDVTLPDISAGAARIRVEAVGNYFYDVNDAPFAIQGSGAPPPLVVDRAGVPSTWTAQFSDPTAATFSATGGGAALSASTTALPAGLTLSGGTGPWTISGKPTAAPGTYPVTVTVTDGSQTAPFGVTVVVSPEDASASYTGPTSVVGSDAAADRVPVALTAQVGQAADGSPGGLDAATVQFGDATSGQVFCDAAPVSASGAATCAFDADLSGVGAVTYAVRLTVGGAFRGTSAGTTAVRVARPGGPAPVVPETTITSGPSGWLLASQATFGLASSVPGSSFDCRLDGAPVGCTGRSVTLTGLTSGSHRLTAVAVGPDGQRSATPAMRDFAVPADDAAMAVAGRWKRGRSDAAYRGTYSQARSRGATLSYRVSDARELVLLVRTGHGYGAARVYLDGRLLSTVRTGGPTGSKAVRVARFPGPRSGRVRIVTTSAATVRIDGLGVSTYPF